MRAKKFEASPAAAKMAENVQLVEHEIDKQFPDSPAISIRGLRERYIHEINTSLIYSFYKNCKKISSYSPDILDKFRDFSDNEITFAEIENFFSGLGESLLADTVQGASDAPEYLFAMEIRAKQWVVIGNYIDRSFHDGEPIPSGVAIQSAFREITRKLNSHYIEHHGFRIDSVFNNDDGLA